MLVNMLMDLMNLDRQRISIRLSFATTFKEDTARWVRSVDLLMDSKKFEKSNETHLIIIWKGKGIKILDLSTTKLVSKILYLLQIKIKTLLSINLFFIK